MNVQEILITFGRDGVLSKGITWYVCIYVCVCAVYVCIHIYNIVLSKDITWCVCTYACVYVCMYVLMCAHRRLLSPYTYVMHTHKHIHIHLHIHIHIIPTPVHIYTYMNKKSTHIYIRKYMRACATF